MEYVDPAMRNNFINQQEPPFRSFVLRSLSFLDDPARVRVVVNALISKPMSLDWPVQEIWTFQSDTWFVEIPKSDPKVFFGGRDQGKGLPDSATQQAEQKRIEKELGRFTLSESHLELGEVKQGDVILREIRYLNRGQQTVSVMVSAGASWIMFNRVRFSVLPGQEGAIQFRIESNQLDGKISSWVSVLLEIAPVKVERRVTLQGVVKAPLTLIPRRLILQDRSAEEILIRNNLQQQIHIRQVVLPHEFLELVEWPSRVVRTIPPGGTLILKLRWHLEKVPADWTSGSIQLRLAEPIEGRRSIFIPVWLANPNP